MTARTGGRRADELRPLSIARHYSRHAEGSALIECGETRVLCTASVEETVPQFLKGKGPGLADRGIRHAAAGDQHAHAARGRRRQAVGPHAGDPAPDRPQPARDRRPVAARRAHDPHRLRRAAGRRRHALRVDHRRLRRAVRRGVVVPGAGPAGGVAAEGFCRGGIGRHRRRRADARSRLRRGFRLRHRHERRDDRRRRICRDPGNGRGRAVFARGNGALVALGEGGIASWSPRKSTRWGPAEARARCTIRTVRRERILAPGPRIEQSGQVARVPAPAGAAGHRDDPASRARASPKPTSRTRASSKMRWPRRDTRAATPGCPRSPTTPAFASRRCAARPACSRRATPASRDPTSATTPS